VTRLAFDTSVLVAALVEPHPLHARAIPWLAAVGRGEAVGECTTHALAETWSVLTRLPIDPAIAPPLATLAIERMAGLLTVIEVTRDVYWRAMQRCSTHGLRSGALFDAVHMVSAETSGADALVTFNPGDFTRLALDGGTAVLVPPDPPGFALPRP
jgi:predicted nucleic acid-binding protein